MRDSALRLQSPSTIPGLGSLNFFPTIPNNPQLCQTIPIQRCPCRQCRRQCKIVASGVNFSIFTNFLCFFLLKLLKLGRCANNQNGNLRWHLPLGVDPPPLNGTNFQTFFYPTFFFCNWILHIWNGFYTSKISLSSPLIIGSNIDILRQLRPLTANHLAMFIVTSTTIYT